MTIADLEHDTEYKIRMRARYYKGEHEGKSWGGPWATETITVAGEPAETPTPEPAEEEPVQNPPKEDPVQHRRPGTTRRLKIQLRQHPASSTPQ